MIMRIMAICFALTFFSSDVFANGFTEEVKHAGKETGKAIHNAAKDIKESSSKIGRETKEDFKKAGQDIKGNMGKAGKETKEGFKRTGHIIRESTIGDGKK